MCWRHQVSLHSILATRLLITMAGWWRFAAQFVRALFTVLSYYSKRDFFNWNPLSLIELNCDNSCCKDLQVVQSLGCWLHFWLLSKEFRWNCFYWGKGRKIKKSSLWNKEETFSISRSSAYVGSQRRFCFSCPLAPFIKLLLCICRLLLMSSPQCFGWKQEVEQWVKAHTHREKKKVKTFSVVRGGWGLHKAGRNA